MTPKRQQNPILVLATLGVYLGLVLAFAGNTVGQTTEANPDQFGIVLNKRPLKDFAGVAGKKIEDGTIKLSSAFKFTLTADLVSDPQSKIVKLSNVQLVSPLSRADESLKKLMIDGVLAVGDSGWFGYLHKFGINKLRIDVEQDESNLSVRILGGMKDAKEASQTASGLAMFMSLGKGTATGDAITLLNAASVSSKDNDLLLSFALPKDTFAKTLKNSIGISETTSK